MIKVKYYDGPVKPSGRTLEEIEKDIKLAEEQSKHMTEWEDTDEQ